MFVPTIKVVSSFCNLDCIYCYYKNKHIQIRNVMSMGVLESFVKKFLSFEKEKRNINFVWHGGEPLTAGISFYEKVLFFQKKFNVYEKNIRNSIQTNGTLINNNWANFLVKNNFSVGLSIDGPENIHNLNRPKRRGFKSFHIAIKGLKKLQERGKYPNIILVVTKNSLGKEEEIFRFFIENGVNNFHPKECYETDTNGQLLSFSITPDEYTEFMKKMFDLWIETDNPNIRIRNLHQIVKGVLGGVPSLCEFSGHCISFLTVEYDGSIGACDSFPIRKYHIGNIKDIGIKDIFKTEGYKNLIRDIQKSRKDCFECSWFKICNGGCLRHSYDCVKDAWVKNRFCESKKALFSYIKKRMEEIQINNK